MTARVLPIRQWITARDVRAADNGVHFCRGCSASGANGWQHETDCWIARHNALTHKAREAARKALATGGKS